MNLDSFSSETTKILLACERALTSRGLPVAKTSLQHILLTAGFLPARLRCKATLVTRWVASSSSPPSSCILHKVFRVCGIGLLQEAPGWGQRAGTADLRLNSMHEHGQSLSMSGIRSTKNQPGLPVLDNVCLHQCYLDRYCAYGLSIYWFWPAHWVLTYFLCFWMPLIFKIAKTSSSLHSCWEIATL